MSNDLCSLPVRLYFISHKWSNWRGWIKGLNSQAGHQRGILAWCLCQMWKRGWIFDTHPKHILKLLGRVLRPIQHLDSPWYSLERSEPAFRHELLHKSFIHDHRGRFLSIHWEDYRAWKMCNDMCSLRGRLFHLIELPIRVRRLLKRTHSLSRQRRGLLDWRLHLMCKRRSKVWTHYERILNI